MFETILFPIHQSKESLTTASKAIHLAQNHNSHVIMLSVIEPENKEAKGNEAIKTLLNNTQAQIGKAGIDCEVIEREGKPAFVICDVADELDVDVIVMGTRGVNLTEDNESTASKVIQLAPCPVLVVP